jgi:tRNA C32,U32 (ribose-2'-O)-methylase TrmJ
LYELYKLRGQNKINSHIQKASRKENDVLMQRFYNIIDSIDFSTEEKRATQKVVWRKIIAQSMMSKREAFAAIGFLRKIEKISRS